MPISAKPTQSVKLYYRAFFIAMSKGYIKLNRTDEAKNLFKRPMESHLLFIIALRISRKDNPVEGLKAGEAKIGDYKSFGMSEQNYRTAKKNLSKWGYITTKSTSKGTIARLCNSDTYDLNITTNKEQPNGQSNGQSNEQVTNASRTGNEQVTTNKKERIKEVKNKDVLPYEKEFFMICDKFKKITGKSIRVQDTPAKIKRSDKYKIIAARLNAGASVEEMIKVIELKNSQWKDDKRQSKYIQFSTLFAASNYEKYIDELDNETPTKNITHKNAPIDPKERFKYFQKVFLTYAPQLDRRLVNGQYKKMLYTDRNSEGLVTMLENEQPKLLELWHNTQ